MSKYLVNDGKLQGLHNYFDPGELSEHLGVSQGERTG